MGRVTSLLEKGNRVQSPLVQLLYGTGIVLVTAGIFTIAVYFLLFYLKSLIFPAYIAIGAVLFKTTFSLKELRRTALRVRNFLMSDKLTEARLELQALVSRDTGDLPESLLVSATVESVAESTSDSFIAPLFYFMLFGVPGAIAYRVVNTMDAMVGYHGKYEYLGKFASRLDDILNFIPARLTAILLVLAAFLSRRNRRASWRVAFNEHVKTESPNAGWPIAAVAGALDVQLEKTGHYQLGKPVTPLVPETIGASLQLMQIAASAWVLICFMAGVIYHVLAS